MDKYDIKILKRASLGPGRTPMPRMARSLRMGGGGSSWPTLQHVPIYIPGSDHSEWWGAICRSGQNQGCGVQSGLFSGILFYLVSMVKYRFHLHLYIVDNFILFHFYRVNFLVT